MKDLTLHLTRPAADGTRRIYRRTSRRICENGRNYLGEIEAELCPRGYARRGVCYCWIDLAGNCSQGFPRVRDCLADFARELAERREANKQRQQKNRAENLCAQCAGVTG